MLQIFIVICAVITFTVMAADPRPSQDQQSASAWQKPDKSKPSQATQKIIEQPNNSAHEDA
ncbi:hypothetical protein [Acinetobacter soli]|uniref:Uncharacterized protein n=1 Tax=Acinetobacter soli NIPH 2899 TaxID=1217677 RepID=A0ABP2U9U3_9GAMM|nr:hypothetical protein [Acinetobacter soli]ENV61547.1 hypothetical protein F950_00820 [Acinetobacter soli NIPH 2899]MBO3640510.1 hypothetical protein [Acinetobacter soli]WEH88410.1 hypothetical protein PX669_12355 [Acinetobacter soli]WEI09693.1 hypothetical protein PYR73_00180 [Acinetobacter soli]WOQ36448.1 hypothetical protein R3L12_13000 [Acinetobacter soli]